MWKRTYVRTAILGVLLVTEVYLDITDMFPTFRLAEARPMKWSTSHEMAQKVDEEKTCTGDPGAT